MRIDKLRVAFVTAETERCLVGGLAEVAKSLPEQLQKRGLSVTRFAPLHDIVWQSAGCSLKELSFRSRPAVAFRGRPVELAAYEDRKAAVPTVYFKDAPAIPAGLARRAGVASARTLINACFSQFFYQGGVYPEGADLGEKYFFAAAAVLGLIQGGRFGDFDLVHFNDWHFSLLPALIKYDPRYRELAGLAAVGTVHNPYSWGCTVEKFEALSGLGRAKQPELYLPWHGLLHNGEMQFLKGVQLADMASTVSPTFARELQTPDNGAGFHEMFRHLRFRRRLMGILNGLDERWDPARDDLIAAKFSPGDPAGKAACRAALIRRFKLAGPPAAPIFGVLARATRQKGFDILMPAMEQLAREGNRFVVITARETGRGLYDQLAELSRRAPGIVLASGYNDRRSHALYAGCDIFVRPSAYEPCGLSQMIAMRYGAVPVVRRTGGLADTVTDFDADPQTGNGFSFDDYSEPALRERLARAAAVFREQPAEWRVLMLRGMTGDYSWDRSVSKYLELYARATANARVRQGR